MPREILSIFVITYNRCNFLENTLNQLAKSPFSACSITILDNCSTDSTPAVCSLFRDLFPVYSVIRHAINIGGNANYLRAVEMSRTPYTWVVCDDDDFDFSDCTDVMEALECGSFDFIYLGSPSQQEWERGLVTTAHTIIARGSKYYSGLTYMPSLIFRTSCFDSDCMVKAYRLINCLYPHFELLNRSIKDDFRIYVAKRLIFIRNELNSSGFYPLFWYASWVTACQTIQDPSIRYRTIDQATEQKGYYKSLGFWIALEKSQRNRFFYKRIIDILSGYNWRQRIAFLPMLPVVIIPLPKSLLGVLRRIVYRMSGHAGELPSIEIEGRDKGYDDYL
ncbi:MAG: glycosyltransferase family 2 protein [Desulfuromonadaceae bacterium]|nr:glycosyltransferase family 2 protein [Desulfuromonadaceae bacterium]